MVENREITSATPRTVSDGPLGLRRKPDREAGRPPLPPSKKPPDPRVEAVRSWSEAAREAARSAFDETLAGGGSREEALELGHLAGMAVHLEEKKLSPAAIELTTRAASLFGARIVGVLPPGDPDAIEERCFERLFPDKGFPEPKPETPAKPPRRKRSDDENQKTPTAREALAHELAKAPAGERQGLLDFGSDSGRRTA